MGFFFRFLAHLYVIHVEWFLIDFLAHVCTCTLSILQLYSFECLPQNIDVQFNKSHVIFSGFITLWLQWLFFLEVSCFDNTNFHDSNNALVSDARKRANTILIIYSFNFLLQNQYKFITGSVYKVVSICVRSISSRCLHYICIIPLVP